MISDVEMLERRLVGLTNALEFYSWLEEDPNCNYIDAGKGTTRAAEDVLELQVCDAPDYKYDTPPDDLST